MQCEFVLGVPPGFDRLHLGGDVQLGADDTDRLLAIAHRADHAVHRARPVLAVRDVLRVDAFPPERALQPVHPNGRLLRGDSMTGVAQRLSGQIAAPLLAGALVEKGEDLARIHGPTRERQAVEVGLERLGV
jgi:hypothetical protein